MNQQKSLIPKLPNPIVIEILSRLPVKSIIRCRRVCKKWLSLISDPQFTNLHLYRSPISLLLDLTYRKQLRLIEFHEPLVDRRRDSHLKLKSDVNFPFPTGGGTTTRIMNSCNGLLCLCSRHLCFICNPILGEFFSISLPRTVHPDVSVCLLGFIPRTDEYKVVHFFIHGSKGVVLARVYTFSERKWRELGEIPYYLHNHSFNTLVNGAIHWLCNDDATPGLIHCFDFDKEDLVVVPEPLQLGSSSSSFRKREITNSMRVGVLDDCLAVCDSSCVIEVVDVWIMRQYGVQESWRKEYVIGNSVSRTGYFETYEPVTMLKNGEILMLFNKEALVVYDPNALEEATDFKRLKMRGLELFGAIAHVPSVVSLNYVAKGASIQSTLDRRMYLAEKGAEG